MSDTVELRLSAIEPPEPEPPRTIYADIVALPDPVKLGLTVRIFNYDDVALYMKVDGYNAAWTFTENELGSLGSGANFYRNLDEFGSRARPASQTEETITVRLRAYTDAYATLKWTFERSITVLFIKSDDGSWTEDEHDDFPDVDGGTVQGWAVADEVRNIAGYPVIQVRTDYVLSTPYSIRMRQRGDGTGVDKDIRARLYKSFTTADRASVFAIADIRLQNEDLALTGVKNVRVQKDGEVMVYLGRPFVNNDENYLPLDKWMRLVWPLPRNETLEVRLVHEWCQHLGSGAFHNLYLDDFRIISKD